MCIPPEELLKKEDLIVVVTVGNYEPIRKQLCLMGIDSISVYAMHFPAYTIKSDYAMFKEALPKIKEVLNLLADEQSKEVFTTVFCNKISMSYNYNSYEKIYSEGEYFKHGIFELTDTESFVDAGAYVGDTICEFLEVVNNRFDNIYSFELDKENQSILIENLEKIDSDIKEKIHVFNKGIWNKEELTCDYDGESTGCAVVQNKEGKECSLIDLDSALSEEKITFIKMDIEGAEIQGLEGAKNILRTMKPKLAVCVYHKPDDFWEIPLKIKQINPDYKIYFRHHSSNFFDTICYAY